jgi:FkbM family methyltransferase
VPASRSQPMSNDASAASDQLYQTASQALLRSYLAMDRALGTVATGWASRRPRVGAKDASIANGSGGHVSEITAGSRNGQPGSGAEAAALARFGDVIACYRLLLRRKPDAEGIAHYRDRLSKDRVTVDELVDEFLGSVEFARAHERRSKAEPTATEVIQAEEGFRIHVDPSDYAVGHTLARTGRYEPEVTATLRKVLAPGATLIDIGANVGWFSLLGASIVGPSGHVVAVEPNPRNVALLRESVKDNGFENVDVLPVALAERQGVAALETDGSNGRVIPIDGPPPETMEASFVVATYPLDELLDDVGTSRVDVMKIDVEGAEPLVLLGATKTISQRRPVLISEFYPMALDCSPWGNAADYLAMLRAFGYRLAVIGHDTTLDDDGIISLANQPEKGHVDLLARPV